MNFKIKGVVPGKYSGSVNTSKQPHGQGVFRGDAGDVYEGGWKDGKKHGQGTHNYRNGEVFVGRFKDGHRHGRGTYTDSCGRVDVISYDTGGCSGEGARWNKDRTKAWPLNNGAQGKEISLEEAAQIAQRVGLPVPPIEGRKDSDGSGSNVTDGGGGGGGGESGSGGHGDDGDGRWAHGKTGASFSARLP